MRRIEGRTHHRALHLALGTTLGVFVDGQVLQTPRGMMMPGMDMPQIAQNNEANLDDLLSVYGVKIKQDIVLDMQNYIGPVQVGGQMLGVNHPVFLVAGPLPQVHQINTGLKAAIFPYASSLELVGEAKDGKGNVTFTKLAETSKESWRPQGPFVFMPTQRARDMTIGTDKGPFPLAYAASGKFKSAFAGKQAVKEDGSKVDGNVSQPGVDPMVSESPATARLVVIADSEFISDQYVNLGLRSGLQLYVANLAYALNIVDWLAQDRQGNVWYLGELAKNYENGELANLDGSWQAGRSGAKPGLWMTGAPKVELFYRQEWAPADAEDVVEVESVNAPDDVPFRNSKPVLMTEDWTPLSPGALELKFYVHGVGMVMEFDPESGEKLELVNWSR
jgi:hypothetical protein